MKRPFYGLVTTYEFLLLPQRPDLPYQHSGPCAKKKNKLFKMSSPPSLRFVAFIPPSIDYTTIIVALGLLTISIDLCL